MDQNIPGSDINIRSRRIQKSFKKAKGRIKVKNPNMKIKLSREEREIKIKPVATLFDLYNSMLHFQPNLLGTLLSQKKKFYCLYKFCNEIYTDENEYNFHSTFHRRNMNPMKTIEEYEDPQTFKESPDTLKSKSMFLKSLEYFLEVGVGDKNIPQFILSQMIENEQLAQLNRQMLYYSTILQKRILEKKMN